MKYTLFYINCRQNLKGLVFFSAYVSHMEKTSFCETLKEMGYVKLAKALLMSRYMQAKEKFDISGNEWDLYSKFDALGSLVKMGLDGLEQDVYDMSHDENIPAYNKWSLVQICQKKNMEKDKIIDMCTHVCRSKKAYVDDYRNEDYDRLFFHAVSMIRLYGYDYERYVDLARGFCDQYKNANRGPEPLFDRVWLEPDLRR